jgi:ligand-binding sensor domain-containing protein
MDFKKNVTFSKPNIFIFFWTTLLTISISCSNNGQSSNEIKKEQEGAKNNILKYTSGVCSILEDSKGNTWFASYNEGVCLLQNGKFNYFTIKNGLSNNQVRNIYEDGNGIIWFESGSGLSTYDGHKMSIYKKRNFSEESKWQLNKSDLWFKSDPIQGFSNRQGDKEGNSGVLQYNGHELYFRKFPVAKDSGDVFDHSVSTDFVKSKNGTFWIGTFKTVIGFNGTDFKIINDELLRQNGVPGSLHVRDIMEDKKGNLWIANNGKGVFKYDGKSITNFTVQNKLTKEDTKGNSLEKVFSLGEDILGNIWFGTVGSGVWRYDGKSLKNFSKQNGLESNHIWTIYTSKQGELLFGSISPSGVYRFKENSFEKVY